MGFINANAYFQPNPRNPRELLVVLKRNLPAGGIYEILINCEADFWHERYHRLGTAARMHWEMPGCTGKCSIQITEADRHRNLY